MDTLRKLRGKERWESYGRFLDGTQIQFLLLQLEPHYEHTYQLVFLLKGKILYQVGEKQYEVSKGGMILLNSLEEHTLKVLEYPYERYIIQINPLFFQKEINTPEIISIFIKRPENFSHLLALTDPIWNYVYDVIPGTGKRIP